MTSKIDETPLLPPSGNTQIQQLIGTLLYYAHAVDSTILPALGNLSTMQASPNEHTIAIIDHLIAYLRTHPDATVR